MKNTVGKILFFILLICSSCSSTYRFSIDIQEPAMVTLPISAQNVLILNNTVTQPEKDGIERTFNENPVSDDFLLSLDSLVWLAIDEIAPVLNGSNFFNTIAIYRQPVRMDSEWLFITGLSPEMQSEFYDMENFDALLVIDRLLFSVKENVMKIPTEASSTEISASVDLRVDGIITCSMYSYEKDKPLTTFSVSDSLFTKTTFYYTDSAFLLKEFPEYILNEMSRILGNQAARRLIPTWKTEKRLFFVNYNSRMQEATSYAADNKWVMAESIWNDELEKKTKPVDKAKIVFNLAVANEMQDKIEQAHVLAQKAAEYLKKANRKDVSQELELTINNYIFKLEQRIQNNRLLDFQWGKEMK